MNSSNDLPPEIAALDAADPLAAKRDEFLIPADTIYLNGNSLGPLTKHAQRRTQEVLETQWGQDLIASWNKHDWIDLPTATGEKIAKLIGAAPGQVICCDSVSVNLFKLLACCLQLRPGRTQILSQSDNFPTDLYVTQGLEALLDSSRCTLKTVKADAIEESLNEDTAVLLLTEVNFRSGDRHDMQKITALAAEKDILVIWDISHSVGVMPLQLDAWQVDFAVGCGYKYLNGGPGAPAFIYANGKHHAAMKQPVQGWMGHAEPFAFEPEYEKASGMLQFLSGTPPIVSLAILDSALDVFVDIAIAEVHEKSALLSETFLELMTSRKELQELRLESKADPEQRGAQLAFSHPDAYRICRALSKQGVVVDYRSPDIVRFGFSPLFLRFADIWQAIQTLADILSQQSYLAD